MQNHNSFHPFLILFMCSLGTWLTLIIFIYSFIFIFIWWLDTFSISTQLQNCNKTTLRWCSFFMFSIRCLTCFVKVFIIILSLYHTVLLEGLAQFSETKFIENLLRMETGELQGLLIISSFNNMAYLVCGLDENAMWHNW